MKRQSYETSISTGSCGGKRVIHPADRANKINQHKLTSKQIKRTFNTVRVSLALVRYSVVAVLELVGVLQHS